MMLSRASLVVALLFLFSAFLQLNDPDPVLWTAYYVAAAGVCVYAARRPRDYSWLPPAVVGLVGLGWALTIAPHALGRIPLLSMFEAWEMKNAVVEENREAIGLFIAAAWMTLLVVARLWKRDAKA